METAAYVFFVTLFLTAFGVGLWLVKDGPKKA
jgi:hypothetical protein